MPNSQTPTDERQLVRQLNQLDEVAFRILNDQYRPLVRRFLLGLRPNCPYFDDLVQDVFEVLVLKALEAKLQLTKGASLQTYLNSIGKIRLFKEYESLDRAHEKTLLFGPQIHLTESRDDRVLIILDLLIEGYLKEKCRANLRAFCHQRLSMDEIADEHGLPSRETARKNKYKCLMRLRRAFQHLNGSPALELAEKTDLEVLDAVDALHRGDARQWEQIRAGWRSDPETFDRRLGEMKSLVAAFRFSMTFK